ncbi:ATP-binding protein [Streptomyces sp. NBC_00268]|uniref:ATP-binding protein n=1 Tax=Streptomyces sp. NBC_00268 TaxID=2975695 RepID=UPI0022592701|nr:ATP-binding protein [Streptomyces sp. NBC_00268]MCX5184896.1 ATP-binding protein [Streptomyces sp. NBC_00268]
MPGYEVTEPRLRCVLPFEAVPAEVRLLRKAAVKQLSRWGTPVAVDEAELLVAELATNVVKHVGEGTSATLILEWAGERLRLEVHDKSPVRPSLGTADCDQECGRGLHLLASLAVKWGTVLTAAGKAVWCEIGLSADRTCLRVERAAEALENYQGKGRDPYLLGKRQRGGLEESAIELIADLLHWTAARGHDPDDFLDRAQMHYEADAGAA